MSKAIRIERRYPHSHKHVWRAITEPDLVSRWLMPTDIRAEVGHRFTFQTKPYPGFDGTVHCEILTAEPPTELAYSWSGGKLEGTIVRFRLEEVGPAETLLHFEHTGFDGLFNRLFTRNFLASGWRGKLLARQLPAVLAEL